MKKLLLILPILLIGCADGQTSEMPDRYTGRGPEWAQSVLDCLGDLPRNKIPVSHLELCECVADYGADTLTEIHVAFDSCKAKINTKYGIE